MNRRKYILNQATSVCVNLYEKISEFQIAGLMRNLPLSYSYPFPISIHQQIVKYDVIYAPYKVLPQGYTKNLSIKELAVIILDAFWFVSIFIKSQKDLGNFKRIQEQFLALLNRDSLTLTYFKIIIFQLSLLSSPILKEDELKWKKDLIFFKLPHISLKSSDWFDLSKFSNPQESIFVIFNNKNQVSLEWVYIVFTLRTGISPVLKVDYLFRESQPTWISEFKSPRNKGYKPHAGFFNHPTMHLIHDWGHEGYFRVALLEFYDVIRNEISLRKTNMEENLFSAAKYLDFLAIHERPFVFGNFLKFSRNENSIASSKTPLKSFVQSPNFLSAVVETEKKFFSIFKKAFEDIVLMLGISLSDVKIDYSIQQINRFGYFKVNLRIHQKQHQICDLFIEFILLSTTKFLDKQKIIIKNIHYNKQLEKTLKKPLSHIKQKEFCCKNIYIKFQESYADSYWLLSHALEQINIRVDSKATLFSEKLTEIKNSTTLLVNRLYKEDYETRYKTCLKK